MVRRRYSANTLSLWFAGNRVSLGDTNVGSTTPRSLSASARAAVSAMEMTMTATVDVAATGGPQPSMSMTASPGTQQLSMTMSHASARRLPDECRAGFVSRLATDVTATVRTPRSFAYSAASMAAALSPPWLYRTIESPSANG